MCERFVWGKQLKVCKSISDYAGQFAVHSCLQSCQHVVINQQHLKDVTSQESQTVFDSSPQIWPPCHPGLCLAMGGRWGYAHTHCGQVAGYTLSSKGCFKASLRKWASEGSGRRHVWVDQTHGRAGSGEGKKNVTRDGRIWSCMQVVWARRVGHNDSGEVPWLFLAEVFLKKMQYEVRAGLVNLSL